MNPPILRHFPDDGRTPNHPRLPLVIYRAEIPERDDPADWLEERFTGNGWTGTWRWGVYDFHHYHSTDHEVLGISSGTATASKLAHRHGLPAPETSPEDLPGLRTRG